MTQAASIALVVVLVLCACGGQDPSDDTSTDVGTDTTTDIETTDVLGIDTLSDPATDTEEEADAAQDPRPEDTAGDPGDATTMDSSDASDAAEDVDAAPSTGCNGHDALCDRPLDQVVFPGTHNAMSNAEERWIAPNQTFGIRRQLEDGIRAMLLDTHYRWDDELVLCHSICELGERLLVDALADIADFMEQNPREILIFIIQDAISPEDTARAFEESGLDRFVYTHDGGAWPTLGAMIDSGERLVVTAESRGPPPDWYHHAWDLFWDTDYSWSSLEEMDCDRNRGSTDNDLFLVNHWVSTPLTLPENAEVANTYEALMARIEQCTESGAPLPTVLAVDFYDIGDVFEVVDTLNGF